MSRRLTRFSLLLVLLLSSEVWAIGLGDIRLDSALNEPLRAEIELLSRHARGTGGAEVAGVRRYVRSATASTGPVLPAGRMNSTSSATGPNGPVVQLRSRSPITEPFLTFLVEATWPSGRLLREYTVLLDPPTYAPPAAQQAPP